MIDSLLINVLGIMYWILYWYMYWAQDFGLDRWLHLLSFPLRSLHFISFHFLIVFFETFWK